MGLDITAYSNLRYLGHHDGAEVEDHQYDPQTYDRLHIEAFAYDCFPHALKGVPDLRETKGWSDSTFLSGGCYEITDKTVRFDFHAGSYGGYSQWRMNLAKQFNPSAIVFEAGRPAMTEPDPALPFYELIWFADNEGTISAETAADLLADFREHAASYDPGDGYPEYMREKYADWTRAFELAADHGLVHFH